MFFPHLMNISSSDLVLEVGPGAYPFWRSDCLVDKFDDESEVDNTQFGGNYSTKGKPLFKIIENKIPFKDNSFDYVICSHVFEHVPLSDLPILASEIMRVAKKAYIEFPRPMYDYVYNLDVHLNLLDIVDNEIICIDKTNTRIHEMKVFQDYLFNVRKKKNFAFEENYPYLSAVGKEFTNNIKIRIIENANEFFELVSKNNYDLEYPGMFWKIKNKFNLKRIQKSLSGEKKQEDFSKIIL